MKAHWPELVGSFLGAAVVTLVFLVLWFGSEGGADKPWPIGFRT